ncbi:MAG: DegQ family serine endoprotease [Gallionella sp.]
MKSKFLPKFAKYGVMTLVITAAMTGGYVYRGISPIDTANASTNTIVAIPATRQTLQRPSAGLPDFESIAADQGPAVVNISVSGTEKTGFSGFQGIPQMDPNDPFYQFFRQFHAPAPQNSIPTHGLGSGFIISRDGVILTNAHVVADADEVIVKLTDKREFKAKVIGIDKPSDVAVLKINAKDLPTVKIGDSRTVRVGQWVVAIGSPFGFENSVTAGIISAKSRSLPDENYTPFLQTDVPINPGNSGGPLFDLNGEVIGINSQIYTQSGGYQGLSFSIPIDVAMKVERQLLDHGKVSRGRLGVVIQGVNQELAKSFGLDKPTGALVSSVDKDSPAEKAGIEPGDVILKFNGKEVDSSNDLPSMVADVTPGTKTSVEVWHDGKTRILSVDVGEMKIASAEAQSVGGDKGGLGLEVRPLTADERKQAEVGAGLLVENVEDGPAANAGIQSGDVILSVNGEKVDSARKLRSLVSKHGKDVALLVLRGSSKMFVPIQLG